MKNECIVIDKSELNYLTIEEISDILAEFQVPVIGGDTIPVYFNADAASFVSGFQPVVNTLQ